MQQKITNQVILQGTILRKRRDSDKWCMTTIITHPVNGKQDTPTVFWYGDMINVVDDAYKEGDHITIVARIATSKKHRSKSLIGVDINDANRELKTKFNIDGQGRYESDINEVSLFGTLDHIYVPEGAEGKFVLGTLRTESDGYVSMPEVVFFQRQMDKIKQMQPGDTVCVIGHVQTRVDEKDGERIYRQSIVSDYTQKVEG